MLASSSTLSEPLLSAPVRPQLKPCAWVIAIAPAIIAAALLLSYLVSGEYLFVQLVHFDETHLMRPIALPRGGMGAGLPMSFAAVAPVADGSSLTPVVFLHGMGDAGSNPGMQSLCQTARDSYPGMYVVCANVANDLSSITTPLAEQIEEFARSVQADPKLKDGFHAVGLSTGGLVLRGYVETKSHEASPPIKRLISVCAPHAGIAACPSSSLFKLVCPLWRLAPYTARLAFADYWKDPSDTATYLERSRWLADINNERVHKNAEYKRRMSTLERYVLIEATNDTTISPHVSESHGYFDPLSAETIQPLKQTEGYRQDFIGLKTLDESGRLNQLQYPGEHLKFTDEFWANVVLPHLGE